MLTQLLLRQEITASLGKTENDSMVHDSGGKISLCDLIYQSGTQEVKTNNIRTPRDRDFFTSP